MSSGVVSPTTDLAGAEPAWPSPIYAWYVVGVLLLANTLSFIDRMILSLLIGPIRAALDITDFQVSLLLGFAFAIFYTLVGLPLGWLADRSNRRNIMLTGVTVWSAMTACCGLANSYATLFLARVGVGAGEATLSPSAFSMLSDYFPRERLARAIAVYSIGVPLGSGIALILGSFIVKLVMSSPPIEVPLVGALDAWRMIFLWVALPGLLIAALMMTIREPARRGRKPQVALAPRRTLVSFISAHRWALSAHMMGMSLIALVMYGSMAWAPTFFVRTYGIPIEEAGLYFGVVTAICGAGGLLAGGWLADTMFRKGRHDAHLRTMLISILLGGPLMTASVLMPDHWSALAVMTVGMFLTTMHGVAGAALQMFTPNELRAQMTAVYFFFANLIGLGLGPSLIAGVTDFVFGYDEALQYSMALVMGVVLSIAGVILALGLRPYAESVRQAET